MAASLAGGSDKQPEGTLPIVPATACEFGGHQDPERQLIPLHARWHLNALALLFPKALLDHKEGVGGEGDQATLRRTERLYVKHLPPFLDEFTFRFNGRRKSLLV